MHPRFQSRARANFRDVTQKTGITSQATSYSMASSDSENSFRTASSGYSDSECGSDSTSDGEIMLHIQPYMFEPKRAVSEREVAFAEDGEDDDDRLGNLDWYL